MLVRQHYVTASDPLTVRKWDPTVCERTELSGHVCVCVWTKRTCDWDRYTGLEKMIHSTTLLQGGVVREPVYL